MKAVNLENPPPPSPVWPSIPRMSPLEPSMPTVLEPSPVTVWQEYSLNSLYCHHGLEPSERFYPEMLFIPQQLPSILTVEPWEPLIQDAPSHSPKPAFQNAEYQIQATDVTVFCPFTRGDIIEISDGGHKHVVLYTQKMDNAFAYIRVVCHNPSMHLESCPILVVRREMCDAPFPHQLRHKALVAIKDDPPSAFITMFSML